MKRRAVDEQPVSGIDPIGDQEWVEEESEVGEEVRATLAALTPWGISILAHVGLIVIAFFLVWQTIVSQPEEKPFSVNLAAMVNDEKTIKGSYMGSCVASRDVPRLLALYKQGRLPVDKLKSGTLRLDQINEGFDRLADGAVVRQILLPHS